MTWPLTHLYENIPHVGAFPFHQDVFLDVQPKQSHFFKFLPISLSSGPRYSWLISTLSPQSSPSKFRCLTAYAWTALHCRCPPQRLPSSPCCFLSLAPPFLPEMRSDGVQGQMEGQIKHKRAQEVQKAGQEKGSFWACRGILSIQSSEQTWRPGEHPSSQHPGGISKEGAPHQGTEAQSD